MSTCSTGIIRTVQVLAHNYEPGQVGAGRWVLVFPPGPQYMPGHMIHGPDKAWIARFFHLKAGTIQTGPRWFAAYALLTRSTTPPRSR